MSVIQDQISLKDFFLKVRSSGLVGQYFTLDKLVWKN